MTTEKNAGRQQELSSLFVLILDDVCVELVLPQRETPFHIQYYKHMPIKWHYNVLLSMVFLSLPSAYNLHSIRLFNVCYVHTYTRLQRRISTNLIRKC